ncbi:MAG: radical SAM family heme chaperone HemW, partial [Muribaculaceae bacterium]|nr:radical SAM family heme chaperone HemW [Muribaculaceae bacterium]
MPYCRRKCIYCDFFSGGASIADWRRYVDAAVAELSVRRDELPGVVESIYFGGGTPSLIPTPEWRRLIEGVVAVIGSDSISECCEITLEANPEDVGPATVGEWIAGGVNRVSLGVQSFNDTLLKRVGRHHSGDEAAAALLLLKESIDNVSADLIFGLPGQTEAQLAEDVDRLISLAPSHVSLYSLMYEEGTALTALRDAGRIGEIDDEAAARMFRLISDRLRAAGYSRYEISNYSLPGYESRHNSGYWWGRPYLGIGPGAHSYDGDRIRRWNPRDIRGWLDTYAPCWRECACNSDDARLTEGSSEGGSSTGFATERELLTDHE